MKKLIILLLFPLTVNSQQVDTVIFKFSNGDIKYLVARGGTGISTDSLWVNHLGVRTLLSPLDLPVNSATTTALNGKATNTGLNAGTTGQFLKKNSNTDYDWSWATLAGGGDLLAANNLSDVANVTTARSNLGLVIGTNVLAPNGSAASLISFPTLNQNTTGTAAGLSANITESQVTNLVSDLAAKAPTSNATFTGTFNVADGAIADADLANTVLPKLTTDANAVYGTTDAGNPGVLSLNNVIRQDAAYTLANVGTEQKLFNASTNGRVTLETGTYFFECVFSISAMSATSGNAAFDILGAGGATLGTVLYHVVGVDGNTATAGTQTGSTMIAAQTPASMVTAGTGTTLNASLRGTFEVTGAGTIQPAVTLVTAVATASVAAGSYFRVRRIGSTTLTTIGQWD